MSIADTLNGPISDAFYFVDDYFWGIAFAFLIGLGIVFTIKLKGMQILRIKHTSSLALSGIQEGAHTKKISSFEAFCIGMGARIGVGNIAGVATAIVTGGPGAVFWMWIFAIIGSASAFMESTLAQIYKEKKSDGQFYGGPAYYAQKGLGSRKLGVFAAILLVLTFGIGFVGVQSCNASSALCGAFAFDNNHLVFAAIIAIVAAILIFKGLKMVAKFSSKVVPIMAVAWIIFAIIAICLNISGVVNAFVMIFQYAFNWQSMFGGGIGVIIVTGLKRGVFSNEAGLGSVANLAATADVPHPVKQGKIQSFGVLVDTLFVHDESVIPLTAKAGDQRGMHVDDTVFKLFGKILAEDAHKARKNDESDAFFGHEVCDGVLVFNLGRKRLALQNRGRDPRRLCPFEGVRRGLIRKHQSDGPAFDLPPLLRVDQRLKVGAAARNENGDLDLT